MTSGHTTTSVHRPNIQMAIGMDIQQDVNPFKCAELTSSQIQACIAIAAHAPPTPLNRSRQPHGWFERINTW